MKARRKRSLRLKERDANDNCFNTEQRWAIALEKVEQALLRGGQMLPICLHIWFAFSTFNFAPSGFVFMQFSVWSFFLLTLDPL